jgi:DNA gyrase subunit B
VDAQIKKANKYQKNESKISFQDIQDCLILVTNMFFTQTSYEIRRKKRLQPVHQEAMTEFFRTQLDNILYRAQN